MAIITFPATPAPRKVDWSPGHVTQVNRSEWTKRRKVTVLGTTLRRAVITMPPILGEPAALAWRAFLADCQGQANSFRVAAGERVQISGVTVQVDGFGQTGAAIATKGWGAAGTKLKRGQFVTINDQLLILRADVVADGAGKAIVTGDAWVRTSPANNTAVIVDRPTALLSLASDDVSWAADVGQQYGFSFQCEEAF